MTEFNTAIGYRVRALRQQAHLTPRQLAKQIGVNTTRIMEIEKGADTPTLLECAHMAPALGRTLDTLLFQLTGDPTDKAANRRRAATGSSL